MQRVGRNAIGRITPFISSMFVAGSPSASPIEVPASADPNLSSPFVIFHTTEDWLNPNYPSRFTSSTMALSTDDLRDYAYRIQQDANGNIILEQLQEVLPSTDPKTFNATGANRVLYRRKTNEQINNFGWTLVRANVLVLNFETAAETRGDSNQPITVKEKFRATFNLPAKSIYRPGGL
jgi:hypothetical protein